MDTAPYEDVSLERLSGMGAPYNPRRISAAELGKLRDSIKRWGVVQPIVCNRRSSARGWPAGSTPIVVGGHQRVRAAQLTDLRALPVYWVDLEATSEKQLNLALNRIQGSWDHEALGAILAELADAGQAAATGFDAAEIDRVIAENQKLAGEVLGAEDAVPALPDVPETKPGDLILLGEHRLACGDANDPLLATRLMDTFRAPLCVTDPPYGVEIDNSWRDAVKRKPSPRGGKLRNDDQFDWASALRLYHPIVLYLWHASQYCAEVAAGLVRVGYDVRQQIVWVKPRMVFSRSAYHWRHEPCYYAVAGDVRIDLVEHEPEHELAAYATDPAESVPWHGGRKQTTVWEVDSPVGTSPDGLEVTAHPTQKPVELYERPILNHTQRGAVVLDPFVGSGTAIVAAERTGRRCFACELDPRWCDAAILRWEHLTGGKARRP